MGSRDRVRMHDERRRVMTGAVAAACAASKPSEEQSRRAAVAVGPAASPARRSLPALDNRAGQKLNAATRAVHAAAFCRDEAPYAAVREDVGRHNALDKLTARLSRAGASRARRLHRRHQPRLVRDGAKKAAVIRRAHASSPVSAPTALAIERAEAGPHARSAIARPYSMMIFSGALEAQGGAGSEAAASCPEDPHFFRPRRQQRQADPNGPGDRRLLPRLSAGEGGCLASPATSTISGRRKCARTSSPPPRPRRGL